MDSGVEGIGQTGTSAKVKWILLLSLRVILVGQRIAVAGQRIQPGVNLSNGIGIEFKFSGGRLETVCQNLPCLGRPLGNGNLDRHVTFLKVGNRQAAAVNDPVHASFISLLQQVIIQIHLPHQITHDVHVGTGLIQRFNHRFGEGQIAALISLQFATFHR